MPSFASTSPYPSKATVAAHISSLDHGQAKKEGEEKREGLECPYSKD